MSKKKKIAEETFSPEQLEKLEKQGDKQVASERQKEGIFQRNRAKRDAKDLASQVRWKRRAGVTLVVLVLVLLLLWIISWLLTTIGDLVITVDSGAAKHGISISEKNPASLSDGEDGGATFKLTADMANDVTNITYDWLPATLDLEWDGSHNGKNYLAYTFYLTNNGKELLNYQSQLQSVKAAKDADEAVRVMIYKNGEPEVFAKENRDESAFEKIYKKVIPDNYTPPETLTPPEDQVQNKEIVDHTDEEIVIQPFIDSETVFNTTYEGLEPGQTDKYTIVMWIEGEDPECIDDIREGYVKLMWFFNIEEEEL